MPERLPPAGVMMLAGFILLGTFFLPWSIGDGTVFSWQAMRGVHGVRGFWPVVLLGSGFVAIVTSRTRFPTALRILGCAIAGLAPIVFVVFFAPEAIPRVPTAFGWRVPVALAGMVLCATGFIYRRVYDGLGPKLLATLGAGAYLAAFLAPFGERLLFVEAIESARDSAGLLLVPPIAILVAALFVSLALVTWKHGYLGAWALLAAWILLFVPPILLLVVGSHAWRHPAESIYPAANLLAVTMLASHGLAAMFARATA
jgi:hypothetical protein